jgi:protein-S-isoprenylcysteine O-methyltransferase Ste14
MKTKKPMPPTFLLSAIVLMVALHFLAPWRNLSLPYRWIPSIVLGVVGVAFNILADGLFKRHKTTVRPFEKSSALITEGVFCFSRHPMYVGMVLILAGLALLMGSATPWIVIVGFAVLVEFVYVRPEETMMEATFGDAYREYKSRVHKWL